MSYSSALTRISELEAKLGIQPAAVTNTETARFDQVLHTAKNGFFNNAAQYSVSAGASSSALSAGNLESAFQTSAAKHGVPVALVKAIGRAESGFRADAKSAAGAQGLMQLMPGTAHGLGVKDPFNAEQSIEGGAKYLANALRIFKGDVKLAVASYNAGTGAVRKYGGVPPYPETQRYVEKVMQYAREYGFNGQTTGQAA
jgi:soluble lytic murein transglycosylase-like protein